MEILCENGVYQLIRDETGDEIIRDFNCKEIRYSEINDITLWEALIFEFFRVK